MKTGFEGAEELQEKMEGILTHMNGMMSDGLGIFKMMGAQMIKEGHLSQAEWNDTVQDLDKLFTMKLDPKRQTEAAAFERKINERLQDLIKAKTEE